MDWPRVIFKDPVGLTGTVKCLEIEISSEPRYKYCTCMYNNHANNHVICMCCAFLWLY